MMEKIKQYGELLKEPTTGEQALNMLGILNYAIFKALDELQKSPGNETAANILHIAFIAAMYERFKSVMTEEEYFEDLGLIEPGSDFYRLLREQRGKEPLSVIRDWDV